MANYGAQIDAALATTDDCACAYFVVNQYGDV